MSGNPLSTTSMTGGLVEQELFSLLGVADEDLPLLDDHEGPGLAVDGTGSVDGGVNEEVDVVAGHWLVVIDPNGAPLVDRLHGVRGFDRSRLARVARRDDVWIRAGGGHGLPFPLVVTGDGIFFEPVCPIGTPPSADRRSRSVDSSTPLRLWPLGRRGGQGQ